MCFLRRGWREGDHRCCSLRRRKKGVGERKGGDRLGSRERDNLFDAREGGREGRKVRFLLKGGNEIVGR